MSISDMASALAEVLRKVLLPELVEMKGEIKALRSEMTGELKAIRSRMDTMDARFEGLGDKFTAGFHQLQSSLDNAVLRGDKETQKDL